MSLTFAGIKRLDSIGGGAFKLYWDAATGGSVSTYNIYVRKGNSSIFSPTYLWGKVNDGLTGFVIRTEADLDTFLEVGNLYYWGVRAEDTLGAEDSNTAVKSEYVIGDGSVSIEIPDRPLAKVV